MRILEQRELARRLEDEDELRVVFADLELVDWCRTITSHAGELLASLGITVTFQTGTGPVAHAGRQRAAGAVVICASVQCS